MNIFKIMQMVTSLAFLKELAANTMGSNKIVQMYNLPVNLYCYCRVSRLKKSYVYSLKERFKSHPLVVISFEMITKSHEIFTTQATTSLKVYKVITKFTRFISYEINTTFNFQIVSNHRSWNKITKKINQQINKHEIKFYQVKWLYPRQSDGKGINSIR